MEDKEEYPEEGVDDLLSGEDVELEDESLSCRSQTDAETE